MNEFELPTHIKNLVAARNSLKKHYDDSLDHDFGHTRLKFTFDGNFVGDLGEALAVEFFGVKLVDGSGHTAVDALTLDGKTVQIKATCTGRGPAFRNTVERADYLLFFELELDNCTGTVLYNGPEHIAFGRLPPAFTGQRSLTNKQIRSADKLVNQEDRLVRIRREPR